MSDLAMKNSSLAVRDPWALVPSLGNLDAYIGAINRVPLLTQEEETEFARRLRDHGDLAAAGRLVVSADATAQQVDAALDAGAVRYLTKPVAVNELLATVDDLLDRMDTGFS